MQLLFILILGGAAFYVIKKAKEERDDLIRRAIELDKEIAESRKMMDEEKARRGVE